MHLKNLSQHNSNILYITIKIFTFQTSEQRLSENHNLAILVLIPSFLGICAWNSGWIRTGILQFACCSRHLLLIENNTLLGLIDIFVWSWKLWMGKMWRRRDFVELRFFPPHIWLFSTGFHQKRWVESAPLKNVLGTGLIPNLISDQVWNKKVFFWIMER